MMKKGWIITLIVLGALFSVQQIVLSKQSIQSFPNIKNDYVKDRLVIFMTSADLNSTTTHTTAKKAAADVVAKKALADKAAADVDKTVADAIATSDTLKKEDSNKIKVIVDNKKVGGITIVPEARAAESTQDNKPFLPQEQNNNAPTPGGILVTLEQKIGGSYITRQEELTVKRGNQSFTISNNSTPPSNTSSNVSLISPPQLEINANNVIARSSMGLSVDPLSGILTVQTPTGPQKVSIMPDEALGIVVELKALNMKNGAEPSILLVSENGILIYRITGERVEKFLGLFPISIQKQILVAADTGSVVKVELPPLSQFLSFFTF